MQKDNLQATRYNQEYVYPDHCLVPKWVDVKLDSFHKSLKVITDNYQNSKASEKIKMSHLQDEIKESLEKNILHPDIRITKVLNKKAIGTLLSKMDEKIPGTDFMWWYYLLMQSGFILSSILPTSFAPEALTLPDKFIKNKNAIVKTYNESKKENTDAIEFQNAISKLANDVKDYMEEQGVSIIDMMNSGAKGNASHIQSLLLSVGLSINSFGEINDVIDTSHLEGMTQTQFFNNSSQAIQALYAKSSETAKPGYLSRKLSTVANNIKLSSTVDCRTSRFLEIKIEDIEVLKSLVGRKYKNTGLGNAVQPLLNIHTTSDLVGKVIKLRSPLYCKSTDGICAVCYGQDFVKRMEFKPGDNIGLVASTLLSEILVSLTLKKSHVGVGLDQEKLDLKKELKKMF